jgi:predicted metal-dependent hydrolase
VSVPLREPQLSPEERVLLELGVGQFNAGRFFECHDTLEELWSGVRGVPRDFFQGLVQVAVAFYHLGNGNLAGASSMLRRALTRFDPFPDRYCGFDLGTHRDDLARWLGRLAGGDVGPLRLEDLPKWRFELD